MACSLIVLKSATADDVDTDPLYYVKRQGVYVIIGLVLMYGVSRLDYSRLRELRYPIYGVLIVSLVAVLGLAQAKRGARAWIELPGFSLQPSELGKVLLVLALAGFVVERMREMGRHTTARVMLLGLLPTMLVMAEPDLGSATIYVAGALAILFIAGRAVAAFRGAGGAVRGQRHVRAGGRAEARGRGARALPGGAADGIPAPVGGSGRRCATSSRRR